VLVRSGLKGHLGRLDRSQSARCKQRSLRRRLYRLPIASQSRRRSAPLRPRPYRAPDGSPQGDVRVGEPARCDGSVGRSRATDRGAAGLAPLATGGRLRPVHQGCSRLRHGPATAADGPGAGRLSARTGRQEQRDRTNRAISSRIVISKSHVLTVFDSPADVISVGDRRARPDLAEEMTQLIYRCVAQPSN
jgi:hypothetical protein